MPLMHQDGGGKGGGPDGLAEGSLRLAELLVPTSVLDSTNAGRPVHPENSLYSWSQRVEALSPDVADTPRSLVPAACFPSQHPRAYVSYSESAQPGGSTWSNDLGAGPSSSSTMSDLVASMSGLAMNTNTASQLTKQQMRYSFHGDQLNSQPVSNTTPATLSRQQCRYSFDGERFFESRAFEQNADISTNRRTNYNRDLKAPSAFVEYWQGVLPPRCMDVSSGYSATVFLGGLPWDISENDLLLALKQFKPVRVEWPSSRSAGLGGAGAGSVQRGYAYVTLENERRVRALLASSRNISQGWFYRMNSRKMRKEVEVIPWAVAESSWVAGNSARLEPSRTVFVGALHGMMTARGLAKVMNELFDGVVYAGIDTDKNKYPIGSGRVTFSNPHSYVRAIRCGYIEINTDKFSKRVQVLPYLEDSMCCMCNLQQGPYFCKEPTCFRYFCRTCWAMQHSVEKHTPLMRNSKSSQYSIHTPTIATVSSPIYSPTRPTVSYNGPVKTSLTNGYLTNGPASSSTSEQSLFKGFYGLGFEFTESNQDMRTSSIGNWSSLQ